MHKFYALLILIFMPHVVHAEAGPFGYRGVLLGADETAFTKKFSEFRCVKTEGIKNGRLCQVAGLTYAGIKTEKIMAAFVNGKFASLSVIYPQTEFSESLSTNKNYAMQFVLLKMTLEHEVGTPSNETDFVPASVGSKVSSKKVIWYGPKNTTLAIDVIQDDSRDVTTFSVSVNIRDLEMENKIIWGYDNYKKDF